VGESDVQCQRCQSEQFIKAGFDRVKRQILRRTRCARRQNERSISAFCGYRFPDAIIALAVRWYLRWKRQNSEHNSAAGHVKPAADAV
jgi:hypothetical protein